MTKPHFSQKSKMPAGDAILDNNKMPEVGGL